jgi:hypothetical protein
MELHDDKERNSVKQLAQLHFCIAAKKDRTVQTLPDGLSAFFFYYLLHFVVLQVGHT